MTKTAFNVYLTKPELENLMIAVDEAIKSGRLKTWSRAALGSLRSAGTKLREARTVARKEINDRI